MTTETITSSDAIKLIFSTLSSPDVERETASAGRVGALARTFGKWRRKPHVVITKGGVVTQGLDYLGAIAVTGKEAEVEVERGATAKRSKASATLVSLLARNGIDNPAPKLAVWRCVAEAFGYSHRASVAEISKAIRSKSFDNAFEELSAVLETTATEGGRPTRVRSKIAFGAFLVAWPTSPRRVRDLYKLFLEGKIDQSTPLGKLLHAVRTDNINTGSGRRPFMLKAAILIDAQLAGKQVERATSSLLAGAESLGKFQAAFEA